MSSSSKHYDKFKVKENMGSANKDLFRSRIRDSDNGISVRSKTSAYFHRDCVKGKVDEDEFVKYMSKLPGYLQRNERGESFQGKALNVGVLDWGRLEKWKQGQKGMRASGCNNASSGGINMSLKADKKSSNKDIQAKKHPYTCSKLDSDNSQGLRSSVQKVGLFHESEFTSRDSLKEHKRTAYNHKSSGRNHTGVDLGKSRRTHSKQKVASVVGGSLPKVGNWENLFVGKENPIVLEGKTRKAAEEMQQMGVNQRALNQNNSSKIGASSSSTRCNGSIDSSETHRVWNDEAKKRAEGFEDSRKIHSCNRKQSDQSRNIVALQPRKHTRNTHSKAPQISLNDDRIDAMLNSFNFETDSKTMHSSDASKTSASLDMRENEPFGRKWSEVRSVSDIVKPRTLDQERFEEEARQGGPSSPNKWLSFSFSRLGRSFSFKEGSAIQQLRSTYGSIKSGPVRSDCSAYPNGCNRARFSPLRRLLDPLLKARGNETVLKSKGKPTSSDRQPIAMDETKQDTSTIQALVQLTTRNGLPWFQFVVDDNTRSLIAGTMKNPTSSEKDDSVQHFTFYSVNEVKKKMSLGWITHGNKGKHSGFVYNIIGQMKLYKSLNSKLAQQKFHSCTVREAVLFEEQKDSDYVPEKMGQSMELAAVVIKNDKSRMENGFEENGNEFRITVVLPDGVHNLPNKGLPSPLIDRWRSGGICDCGGWDIGCKLHVLSGKKHFYRFSGSSEDQLFSDRFQLFDQEGTHQNIPVFTMLPLKDGIFSVEFNPAMSLLQAFFICVTVISCEKSSNDSEFNVQSETKAFEDTAMQEKDATTKGPFIIVREIPAKYATINPPLSPVDRV